jgi:hypothetical protein
MLVRNVSFSFYDRFSPTWIFLRFPWISLVIFNIYVNNSDLYIVTICKGEGEVVPVLDMEAYWGGELQLHALFDLGIRWR